MTHSDDRLYQQLVNAGVDNAGPSEALRRRVLAAAAAAQEQSTQGDDATATHGSAQPSIRLVPDVPTDQAGGDSRETRPIEQPPGRRHVSRRFIAMFRYKTVRWAAVAAAIVIAFVGLAGWLKLSNGKSGLAFADVVRHFTEARTARYTVVVELEGQDPVTFNKQQDFDPESKGLGGPWDNTGPMGMQMLPREWTSSRKASDPMSEGFKGETIYFFGQADGEGMQDFFQVMGQVHKQARADLGSREIDGQPAVGFHFEQDGTAYSIWANAASGLPVRIDITNQRLLGQGKVTVGDFEFDVEIPRPLMGMGGFGPGFKYSLTEAELIDALRRWAKRHDGRLPRFLAHQAWFFDAPDYFRSPRLSSVQRQQIFVTSTRVIIRGVAFASQLPSGDNWKYLGQGMTVDLQDGQTPICWYQPEGSQDYRVIYRDLSVRDVPADKLPLAPVTH